MAEIPKQKAAILIIDDDEQIRKLLKQLLSAECECTTVGSAEEALAVLGTTRFELVISDINLGGISGLDLVPKILAKDADSVVVMISGQQTIDFAIEAMRVGAFDYITKPLDIRHVQAAVRRALVQRELLRERRLYEDHLEELVKERTAKIEHLAYYDRLTNLPNRALFADRLQHAVAQHERDAAPIAVLFVDLDDFKRINDTFGHTVGDHVLAFVAERIKSCLRQGDTAARLGGDEFGVLLEGATREVADQVAARITEALQPVLTIREHLIHLSASIGMGLGSQLAHSESLVHAADTAMYIAKRQSKIASALGARSAFAASPQR